MLKYSAVFCLNRKDSCPVLLVSALQYDYVNFNSFIFRIKKQKRKLQFQTMFYTKASSLIYLKNSFRPRS